MSAESDARRIPWPSTTRFPRTSALLYWLGDKLIDYRHPVSIVVLLVTALFAYWGFQLQPGHQLRRPAAAGPQYIKIHNRFSGTFGGANNIMVMLEVKDGTIFTPETLNKIWKMTEGLDKVYGVNHNQIDSIAHRTVRYLKVAAGGTMRAQPVMLGEVQDAGRGRPRSGATSTTPRTSTACWSRSTTRRR